MRKEKKAKNSKASKRLRHTKKRGFWDVVWKDRSTGGRIGVVSLAVAGVALIVAIAMVLPHLIWFLRVSKQYKDGSYDSTFSTNKGELGITNAIDFPDGITNIALFGIDSRSDNMRGLSDSIMIISIDAVHNDIKLVSVVRDSLVKVDGHGYQKINAAYSLGGAQLAVKTLNKTFSLNIMDYATVDFVGMANIIDSVGGIEATLSDAEVTNANVQINEMHISRGTPRDYIKKSGTQTLNGIQAVAYSRIRKVNLPKGTLPDGETNWGDFARTYRQRYVMTQLFQKALELDLNGLKSLIEVVLPYLQTSLSFEEVFDLAKILLKDGIEMKQDRIPTDEAVIVHGLNVKSLGSCVYYDLDYAAELLHAFLFNDITFDDYMEANGVKKNRWFNGTVITDTPATDDPDLPPETEDDTDTDHSTDTSSGTGSSGKNSGGGGGGGGSGGSKNTDSSQTTDSGGVTDSGTSSGSSGSSGKPSDSGSTDSGESTDAGSSDSGTASDRPAGGSDSSSQKPSKPSGDSEDSTEDNE